MFGDNEGLLSGRKVAILSTDGFEQSELLSPKAALEDAGAEVDIVSLKAGEIRSWRDGDWGIATPVDKLVSKVSANEYDALMLPGGVIAPDRLRMDKDSVIFVKGFVDSHRPIAAICHGPQTLIETGIVKGKKLTSWPSLKTDLTNAGARWVDEPVVVDEGLVTSRNPGDLPLFNKRMIEEFAQRIQDRHLPDTEGFSTTL